MYVRFIQPDEVPFYIKKHHTRGHGIENGLSPEEHVQRLLTNTYGMYGLVVFDDTHNSIGGAILVNQLVDDAHFPCKVLHVAYMAGYLGYTGMKALIQKLNSVTKDSGGAMFSIPRRISKYKYETRLYEVT